jgi:hypothetical protein
MQPQPVTSPDKCRVKATIKSNSVSGDFTMTRQNFKRFIISAALASTLALSAAHAYAQSTVYLPFITNPAIMSPAPAVTPGTIPPPPAFTFIAFEDGSVRIEMDGTATGVCIRSEWGCTPETDAPPFTFFEDGSVRMTINETTISFCAFTDMGCN